MTTKTISQRIREEHKNYLSKKSLVQTESEKFDKLLQRYSNWNFDEVESMVIGIDPSFKIENVSYNFDWSHYHENPTTFNYRFSSDIYKLDLRKVTKQESSGIITEFYNTKELVETLIEKNKEGINGVLSEIDHSRKMTKMYNEMELTTTHTFEDKVHELMTIQNEYIELPRYRRFEQFNENSYCTNWKVNTKWVKFRYQNEKPWYECSIEGYTIKGKVKQNYLVDLKSPQYDELIQNVLLTPKELYSIKIHSIDVLRNIEQEGGCVDGCDLSRMSNDVLSWERPVNSISKEINELMDIYSDFRVVFHEGDDIYHKFEVHEWNSVDPSWTHIKTYFLENYYEHKKEEI